MEVSLNFLKRVINCEVDARFFLGQLLSQEKSEVLRIMRIFREFPLNTNEEIWLIGFGSFARGEAIHADIDLGVYVQNDGMIESVWDFVTQELKKDNIPYETGQSPLNGTGLHHRPVIWIHSNPRAIHLVMPYEGDVFAKEAMRILKHPLTRKAWTNLLYRKVSN